MLEAADEHQPLALGERLAAADRLVDVGEQQHLRFGQEAPQHVALHRRNDDRHVDAPDQRKLLVAARARRGPCHRTALDLGQPLGAQEVQVDGVERDQRLRREAPDRVDVLRRDVVPREDHQVELAAAPVEDLGDRGHVGGVQHLDAALPAARGRRVRRYSRLSPTNVTFAPASIASSSIASVRNDPESWSGVSMRASTIRTRRVTPRSRSSSGCTPLPRCDASTARPLRAERVAVGLLVLLHAGAGIGARGLALEVHDGRRGLVVDAAPRRAHREREIRVLVVGRLVALRRTRPAHATAPRGSRGTRPSSSRPRAGSCTRAGRDRRRGRRSTPSRRATRCRRPPAGGRPG